jgi:hypothetical protein
MIGTIGVGGQTQTHSNIAEFTLENRELSSALRMGEMNAIVIH